MTARTNALTIQKEVHNMPHPSPNGSSLANERNDIRQLYKAGHLTAELATVQLLRLDIDEIVRARTLAAHTDPPAASTIG
jgi:hypothetical protein